VVAYSEAETYASKSWDDGTTLVNLPASRFVQEGGEVKDGECWIIEEWDGRQWFPSLIRRSRKSARISVWARRQDESRKLRIRRWVRMK